MNFPPHLARRWGGQRYQSLNRALKDKFHARVHKIGIRMDFTCPNRDGAVAVGGCIYCNNASHTPQGFRAGTSVTEQLAQGAAALARRHHAEKFIAYFQSYSNTYGPPEKLARLYREALAFPGIVGLAVSTRPDCVPDDVLDLLAELARGSYLWLEMGLESMHDKTLRWVNRGHDLKDFIDAVARAKQRGLRVCAHLILGFPSETRGEMLEAAAFFNALGVDGVKLHNLHIIRDTALADMYLRDPFPLMSRAEYADLVVDFLERLSPEILIHRLSGETYRALTVAPEWSIDKMGTHNAIQRALESRDAWQGRLAGAVSSFDPSTSLRTRFHVAIKTEAAQ
jgi:hypothetical protein